MVCTGRIYFPPGFPDHPHRGFETLTYSLNGKICNHDFAGRKAVIGPGDLQVNFKNEETRILKFCLKSR
jgi:redox-sensitive bicupin YhaK (pirin superfamily)